MPESVLNWMSQHGTSVLDGNTVEHGKRVWLREFPNEWHEPARFEVRRQSGGLLDRIRDKAGVPVAQPAPILPARRSGKARMWRSRDSWSAGVIGGTQAAYRFACQEGHLSGVLMVTTWGISIAAEERGVSVEAKTSLITDTILGVGVKARAFLRQIRLRFNVQASVDPMVRFELLTPWGHGNLNLQEYVRSQIDRPLPVGADEDLLPADPPERWELSLDARIAFLGASSSMVLTLDAKTPTLGRTAVAIRVVDVNDPTKYVVSDLIELDNDRGFPAMSNEGQGTPTGPRMAGAG